MAQGLKLEVCKVVRVNEKPADYGTSAQAAAARGDATVATRVTFA
jgi:hypothetical protein